MKIGICCFPSYGGSGVVASELARALAATGDEVSVLSSAVPPRLLGADSVATHVVEGIEYPLFDHPSYTLALAGAIVELTRELELELIHVHYAVPLATSALLARQILTHKRLGLVVTCHGTDVAPIGNDRRYLETTRHALGEADVVTAVSSWLAERVRSELAVERQVEVIPNFVDDGRFVPGPAPLSLRERRTLVHVSNFRSVKRPADALEVLHRLRRDLDARLVMVGDGPERAAARRRASALGLDPYVEWLDSLPNVETVLQRAGLLLVTSESESFGVAALEAMACGLPVVATAVGGQPEVIADGRTGLLVEPGDFRGMAAAVRQLLDTDRGRLFGLRGRRRVMGSFTARRVVPSYRRVYERALAAADRWRRAVPVAR